MTHDPWAAAKLALTWAATLTADERAQDKVMLAEHKALLDQVATTPAVERWLRTHYEAAALRKFGEQLERDLETEQTPTPRMIEWKEKS